MNKNLLYVVAFVAVFLCGGLLSLLLFKSAPKKVNFAFEVKESTWSVDSLEDKIVRVEKKVDDLKYKVWQFVTQEGESVYVDSHTYYKDVPIATSEGQEQLTVYANKKPLAIPFSWQATTKGPLLGLSFTTNPTRYDLELEVPGEPWARIYGNLGLFVKNEKYLGAGSQIGLLFKKKISLYGGVDAWQDTTLHIDRKLGLQAWFGL